MRPLAILAMLTLMAPRVATGQVVSVGPRLALGTGSALTAQAGMRAELAWTQWGVYGGVGVRRVGGTCLTGSSGSCTLPDPAWELVAGFSGVQPGTPAYFSVGVGAIRWGSGTDPLLEGELGVRLPASGRVRLGVGLHLVVVPEVKHPNVSRTNASFAEVVLGLVLGLGRR